MKLIKVQEMVAVWTFKKITLQVLASSLYDISIISFGFFDCKIRCHHNIFINSSPTVSNFIRMIVRDWNCFKIARVRHYASILVIPLAGIVNAVFGLYILLKIKRPLLPNQLDIK